MRDRSVVRSCVRPSAKYSRARDRADQALVIVAERLPYLAHALHERIFGDDGLAPYGGEQFALSDQPIRLHDEVREHCQRLRAQLHSDAAVDEPATQRVEMK